MESANHEIKIGLLEIDALCDRQSRDECAKVTGARKSRRTFSSAASRLKAEQHNIETHDLVSLPAGKE